MSQSFRITYFVSDRILSYKFREVPTVDIFFNFEAILDDYNGQTSYSIIGQSKPIRLESEHSNSSPAKTLNSHGSNRNIQLESKHLQDNARRVHHFEEVYNRISEHLNNSLDAAEPGQETDRPLVATPSRKAVLIKNPEPDCAFSFASLGARSSKNSEWM